VTERSAERRAALIAASMAVPLVVLTLLVMMRFGPLVHLDRSVSRQTYDAARGTGWQRAADIVSAAWQPRIAGTVTGLVAAWFAVRRQWLIVAWIVASMVVTTVGWELAKLWIERPRPDIPHQIGGWSYPSGHASEIACAMTLFAVITWPRVRPGWRRSLVTGLWVVIALVVGVARVVIGAHFPSDVVAGWLLGALVAYLIGALLGVIDPRRRHHGDERPLSTMPEDLRTLAVIVNPTKVDADAFRAKVSESTRAAGWDEPLWFETTVDDAGASMARAAVAAGADVVMVAGGDGTVRVVCAQLASTGVPVGVVPIGTGNLLARNLGIPLGRDQALDVVLRGQDRAVDLVQVKGDDLDTTRFLVMAGMGLDAAIMDGAPDALKRRVGWPAYFLAGLRHLRYPAVRIDISVDGAEPVRRRARTVVVGNVGILTGGIPLIPDARVDDGLLDVVVIAPRRVLGWLSLVWRVLTKHPRTDERLDRFTGRSVVLTAASPTPRQLDGDTVGSGCEIHAEIEPGVLLLRVPR
jgi:diacylglycerol kinase family enzyme/membrane-associated phospholipid phosphatase